MSPPATRLLAVSRAARLRCPRCGVGPLFAGFFRMHAACPRCGFSYEREPGFYLGSIYFNYGATVILTGGLYALLVQAAGRSHETALAACLVAAVLCPMLLFRHARSFLLALDSSVNQTSGHEEAPGDDDSAAGDAAPGLGRGRLAALRADDGRAGCAMGVALVLILLFGLGMAVVTILHTLEDPVPRAIEHGGAADDF